MTSDYGSQCRCGPYKAIGAYFYLVRNNVLLNGVALSQEGAIGPFFEGDMLLKKKTPKSGAVNGTIAGILLTASDQTFWKKDVQHTR
jgi:hypothetical protein